MCRHHRELLTAEFVCGITPIELNFPICARTCCKQNQCQSNCSIFKAPKKHTALHFPTCQNTLIFSTVLRHKCAHQHGITFYEWKDPSLFEPAVKLVTMFVVDLGTTLSCLRMMNDTVSDHRAGSNPTPSPRPATSRAQEGAGLRRGVISRLDVFKVGSLDGGIVSCCFTALSSRGKETPTVDL